MFCTYQNNLEKELNNRIHKDSSYNINKTIIGLKLFRTTSLMLNEKNTYIERNNLKILLWRKL